MLKVELANHSYEIFSGWNILRDYRQYLPETLRGARHFVICDEHTRMYARQIAPDDKIFAIKAGEASKSVSVYEQVVGWLLSEKISRQDSVIALGGGVVGDLAGFAAASVLRGVPVIQIPTSLLAMVDSSVGGKTGINMPQGKNLVGAFHQPAAVIMDFATLETLPLRELKAGYAEILKYALLGDAKFFDWLEEYGKDVLSLEPEALEHAVKRSCRMKSEIVRADERETSGKRALLNLGHTFAHALEALMGYDGRLLHGEAVSIGMICAMQLSEKLGHLSPQKTERVVQHLRKMKLKNSFEDIGLDKKLPPDELLEMMYGDKKVKGGKINFVLLNNIGTAFISDKYTDDIVLQVLSNS